jgi:hypothetical protein
MVKNEEVSKMQDHGDVPKDYAWAVWTGPEGRGAYRARSKHGSTLSEGEDEMVETEETVWCDVAGGEVPACECGPHEDCPEHLLNCVLAAEEAAYFERKRQSPEVKRV